MPYVAYLQGTGLTFEGDWSPSKDSSPPSENGAVLAMDSGGDGCDPQDLSEEPLPVPAKRPRSPFTSGDTARVLTTGGAFSFVALLSLVVVVVFVVLPVEARSLTKLPRIWAQSGASCVMYRSFPDRELLTTKMACRGVGVRWG